MNSNSDRITGAFIAVAGLVLFLFVIPKGVETVDSGWLLPQSMPNILALILIFCGAVLVLKPAEHEVQPLVQFVKCGMYLGLLSAGLLIMSFFGFMYTAPIIALAIMLLIGERRVFWLVLGIAGIPASIWFILVWLLERALP